MNIITLPRYELRRETDPETGERVYYPERGPARSVTTILDQTSDKQKLEEWRESIGFARADHIKFLGSSRGTRTHDSIETWLCNRVEPKFNFHSQPYWKSISIFIKEKVGHPVLIEGSVWHSLGFAGTLDCLAYMLGTDKIFLFDWKTANSVCKPYKLYSYKLQCAAYYKAALEVYSQFGLEIAGAYIVVGLLDQEPQVEFIAQDELEQLFLHFQARLERMVYPR